MGIGPRGDAGLGLRGVGRAGGRHGQGGAGGRHGCGGAVGRRGVPADGMAVEGPADGVEVGGVSETRERRLRRGAFSMAGKSHTGTGTVERE